MDHKDRLQGQHITVFRSFLGSLVDERLVNVRDDTAASNGALDESVKLLVSTDGKLQVARGDTLHLKILAGVTSQLQDLSGQVLEDRCRVHSSSGTNTAVCRDPLLELPVDTTYWELDPGARGAGHGSLFLILVGGALGRRRLRREQTLASLPGHFSPQQSLRLLFLSAVLLV